MSKNGEKFDQLQLDTLRQVVQEQQANKQPTNVFLNKARELWQHNLTNNPFYKKAPKCFRETDVFLLQFAKVIMTEVDGTTVDQAIDFLYRHYVTASPIISSCLDVDANNARSVLKRINLTPTRIPDEQNNAEEKLCQWAKELTLMGVDRETIQYQVDMAINEIT